MRAFLLSIFLILAPALAGAETTWDNAQKKELGRLPETTSTSVSTTTATVLWSQSFRAVTTDIFNNSAYTLWIGSNTASLQTTGMPILSSKTYTIDGLFPGTIYGLGDSSANSSTINVRIIQYKMQSGD